MLGKGPSILWHSFSASVGAWVAILPPAVEARLLSSHCKVSLLWGCSLAHLRRQRCIQRGTIECQSCPLGCVAKKGQKFKAAGSREGTRVGLTRQGVRYTTCGTKSLVVGNWSEGQAREHRGHLDLSRGGCPNHRDPVESGDTHQSSLGRLGQEDHL